VAESLRIGMTSYYLPSGSKIGVGYQVHALANALVDRGHEVEVHSVCPPSRGARYRTVQHRVDGSMRTFRWAGRVRQVGWDGYDVLHAHGDDYWLWGPGIRRAPVHVRTLHGSCFEEALHISGGRERLRMVALGMTEVAASLVADRTVVVSPETRRWFPWVHEVVPNGVDLTRFRPGTPAECWDRPVVLMVGTWEGRKRGRLLAEAFERSVVPRIPDAELWMVAEDVPQPRPRWLRALGRVDDDELAHLYRQAWVFALPSSYEGFGIPYVEAMASGLPVVASRNPGARFVTDDGSAGLLVDDESLGRAMHRLLADPDERDRLRQSGLHRARHFDMATVVSRYEGLYRQAAR